MDANDVESVDDDFYSGDMEDDYYSDGVYYDNDDDDVNDDDDGPDYDFMAEAVDDPDDLSFRSQVIFLFGFFCDFSDKLCCFELVVLILG